MAAARDGNIATVRKLLTNGGVDVNMKDEVGVFTKWIRDVSDKVGKLGVHSVIHIHVYMSEESSL